MISLTRDADGLPVASFGSGTPFGQPASAGHQTTSPAQVTDTGTFGERPVTSTTTPSPITPTAPGSTANMGYQDPTKGSRRAVHQGPMTPSAPSSGDRQLTSAGQGSQRDPSAVGELVKAANKKFGPPSQDQPNRTDEFGAGAAGGRPGGDVPGGAAGGAVKGAVEDAAEDLLL